MILTNKQVMVRVFISVAFVCNGASAFATGDSPTAASIRGYNEMRAEAFSRRLDSSVREVRSNLSEPLRRGVRALGTFQEVTMRDDLNGEFAEKYKELQSEFSKIRERMSSISTHNLQDVSRDLESFAEKVAKINSDVQKTRAPIVAQNLDKELTTKKHNFTYVELDFETTASGTGSNNRSHLGK